MLEIDIHYRPVRFLPWEKHKKVNIPLSWNELTEKQFISVTALQPGVLSKEKVLQIFFRINSRSIGELDSYQKHSILRHLKYLEKPEPLEYFKISQLSILLAPKPCLENVSLRQFILGDTSYQNYIEGHKDDLNRFIACFYTGVIGFDEKLIGIRTRLCERTDLKIREAIAINYGLIREWLLKTYPYAFRLIDKVKRIERSESLDNAFEYIYCQEGLHKYEKALSSPLNDKLYQLEYISKLHFNSPDFNPYHTGMFLDPNEVKFPDIKILNPNCAMLKDGKFIDPNHN